MLDKAQSGNIGGSITADSVEGTCRLPQQASTLVVTRGAWLATLALGALVFAGWRLYGPASRCEDDRVCSDPRVLQRRRRLLWVVVAAVIPLLPFPYYIMKAQTVTVSFDPVRVTPAVLVTAVSDAGFPAKVGRNGS